MAGERYSERGWSGLWVGVEERSSGEEDEYNITVDPSLAISIHNITNPQNLINYTLKSLLYTSVVCDSILVRFADEQYRALQLVSVLIPLPCIRPCLPHIVFR